jgi:nucleoside-diphosphate-sugar epimerase
VRIAVLRGGDRLQVVLLFGLGLIGAAILRAIEVRRSSDLSTAPFSWHDSGRQAAEGRALLLAVESILTTNKSEWWLGADVHTVWSAGRAGFASAAAELDEEFESFRNVVEVSSNLADAWPQASHAFHLVSSAGGLFEGQVAVCAADQPRPRRSYGELKLRQERFLSDHSTFRAFVYRPSSVYGVAGAGARAGLIPTLLRNALNGAVSSIYGEPTTLRDYVFADDVGRFIAERIISTGPTTGSYILASGKPTTVLEVCRSVEAVLDRSLYVAYHSATHNAAHTTFRPSALPDDWRPMDIYTGIRLCHARMAAHL